MMVKYDVQFAMCEDGTFHTAKILETKENDALSEIKQNMKTIQGILHKNENGEYFFSKPLDPF